jgi:hypothetical protein
VGNLFVIFIILASGFALYALLKPPVVDEPVTKELYPEIKISSISSPEYSKVQPDTRMLSTKEE